MDGQNALVTIHREDEELLAGDSPLDARNVFAFRVHGRSGASSFQVVHLHFDSGVILTGFGVFEDIRVGIQFTVHGHAKLPNLAFVEAHKG